MAGKTGTAQMRVISKEERLHGVRSNESLPWNLRDHGLFIGFAPVDRPRYACAVVIEHGGLNSHPHVQIARDALALAQTRNVLGRPRRLSADVGIVMSDLFYGANGRARRHSGTNFRRSTGPWWRSSR